MKRQRRKIKINKQLSTKSNKQLEKETLKLIRKANARLDSLQRRYKSGTWSTKKLTERLNSKQLKMMTKNGKIKVKKNMTNTQMVAVNKAVNQFLKSSTSTKKGISQVKKKTIESLRTSLSTEDVELSTEDAEKFYNMFGDDDFSSIADKIGASALQSCIEDAIEENDSEDSFIKRLEIYGGVTMNDIDIRNDAKELFEKYVL